MRDLNLIIDVGMNDGADAAFYLAKGFRVIAIEANPELVKQATKRFVRELSDGSLKIIDKAIGPNEGRVQFFVHRRKHDWSTLNPGVWSADEVDSIEIDCVTFDSVLRKHGVPYYLKIDIEGADVHAIASLERAPDLPIYVSAEAQSSEIVDKLYDLGYRGFKLVDQAPAARYALPWLAREGCYVDMTFGWHHSGPFGEETPGLWQSREDVLLDFRRATEGPMPSWYDFHAKLGAAGGRSRPTIAALVRLPLIASQHAIRTYRIAACYPQGSRAGEARRGRPPEALPF